MEQLVMYGLPLWGFITLFFFYGYGEISLVMFNKIAGLLGLGLIAASLLIGPISFFLPYFDRLKIYRKYLGVAGFLIALVHAGISYSIKFHSDASFMFSPNNPYLLGVWAGLLGIGIFALMTLTSNNKAVKSLGFKKWKIIQSAGYIGLLAVMLHFILMETNKGVFVIRRPLGRVIFIFGFFVILLRFVVFLRGDKKAKS